MNRSPHFPTPATQETPPGLSKILERLEVLREIDPQGPFSAARPTDDAYTTLHNLLFEASARLSHSLPMGFVAPDGEGGVQIDWEEAGREVRLIIPADATGDQYLYWEEGDRYDVVDNATVADLVDALNWCWQVYWLNKVASPGQLSL